MEQSFVVEKKTGLPFVLSTPALAPKLALGNDYDKTVRWGRNNSRGAGFRGCISHSRSATATATTTTARSAPLRPPTLFSGKWCLDRSRSELEAFWHQQRSASGGSWPVRPAVSLQPDPLSEERASIHATTTRHLRQSSDRPRRVLARYANARNQRYWFKPAGLFVLSFPDTLTLLYGRCAGQARRCEPPRRSGSNRWGVFEIGTASHLFLQLCANALGLLLAAAHQRHYLSTGA